MSRKMKRLLESLTKLVQRQRKAILDEVDRRVFPKLTRAVAEKIHVKQFKESEQELSEALKVVIGDQTKELIDRLTNLKDQDEKISEGEISKVIGGTSEWNDLIVDASFPLLLHKSLEAAASQFALYGVRLRRKDYRSKYNEHHDRLGRFASGSGSGAAMAPDTGTEIGGGGSDSTPPKQKPEHTQEEGRKLAKESQKIMEMSDEQLKDYVAKNVTPTGSDGGVTKYDLVDTMSKKNAEVHGKVELPSEIKKSNYDEFEKAADYLAEGAVGELVYADEHSKDSGAEWYKKSIETLVNTMAEIHPELGYGADGKPLDQAKQDLFFSYLAITSNGQPVKRNLKDAEELYAQWKATISEEHPNGNLVPKQHFDGMREKTMRKQLKLLQKMVDKTGDLGTIGSFFRTEFEVGELEDYMRGEGGGEKSFRVMMPRKDPKTGKPIKVLGSTIIGPKVGSFFNNLTGNFDTVTADSWFTEAMHRLCGDATDVNEGLVRKHATSLLSIIDRDDFPLHDGVKKEDLKAELEDLIEVGHIRDLKNSAVLTWTYRQKVIAEGPDAEDSLINAAGKNLYDNAKGIKGAPDTKTEWYFVNMFMAKVREKLASQGREWDTATAQAVWWYFEKHLIEKLGVSSSKMEATDYAAEAFDLKDLLIKEGKLVDGKRHLTGNVPAEKPKPKPSSRKPGKRKPKKNTL